jgi:hypothetical protein
MTLTIILILFCKRESMALTIILIL